MLQKLQSSVFMHAFPINLWPHNFYSEKSINCFKFFIAGRLCMSHKIFSISVAIFCYLFLIHFLGMAFFFLFVQILIYCQFTFS